MGFLKNLSLNLQAAGPAAVLIVWVISIASLGIFGEGPVAEHAMTGLLFLGALIFAILAQRT